MKIVISLGGSLITGDFRAEKIKSYAQAIKKIKDNPRTEKLAIVTGGGKIAREYIEIIKGLGMDHDSQDTMAITLTHANAKLMSLALESEKACPNTIIPRTEREVSDTLKSQKLIVCGGTIPGQSTDSVAAKIAKEIKADILINASNTDGVYDRDPKKYPQAKKFDKLSYDHMNKILSANEQSPGKYALFDRQALEIVKKEKIKVIITDASDPEELIRAVDGTHSGTTIE